MARAKKQADPLASVEYTKRALVLSSWFSEYSDLLESVLDPDKRYTRAKSEEIIKKNMISASAKETEEIEEGEETEEGEE